MEKKNNYCYFLLFLCHYRKNVCVCMRIFIFRPGERVYIYARVSKFIELRYVHIFARKKNKKNDGFIYYFSFHFTFE